MPIFEKITKPLLMGLILVFGPGIQAQATVTTTGCVAATSCTLQELVDGGSIEINGVVFDNFVGGSNIHVEVSDPGPDEFEDSMALSLIIITGIDEIVLGDPTMSTLGLSVSSEMFTLPYIFDAILEGEMEHDFSYDTLVGGGRMLTAAELLMGSHSLDSNDAFIEANLDISTLTPEDFFLTVYDINGGANPGTDLADDQALATAVAAASMAANVQMGTFVSGGVTLGYYDMLFTVQGDTAPPPPPPVGVFAPEGMGILMGALGVFALSRRRKALIEHKNF